MASSPPDDDSFLPAGWSWSDVGHGLLDVAGVVPVVGEAADLANAAWLASEGNYLDAGLSVVSMIPVVGDIVGKGGKIAKKAGSKLAGPALDMLKKIDFRKALDGLRSNPKLGPYVDKMIEALDRWRDELVGKAAVKTTPSGVTECPYEAYWERLAGKPRSLNNRSARAWYLSQEKTIPDLIDKALPKEQQARQAFELRNKLRERARELMEDQKLADKLRRDEPNLSWDELVFKKSKKYNGDKLWNSIIESSQSSRQEVNDLFGFVGDR